jgi:glycosyltransferase involved in cell wall biosynthesis
LWYATDNHTIRHPESIVVVGFDAASNDELQHGRRGGDSKATRRLHHELQAVPDDSKFDCLTTDVMTPPFEREALTEGLISVVVAFYNAERFLAEAIDSVLAQTYTHWELMLVDDGSSDSAPKIARSYAAQYPSRIFCLAHPGHRNLGMCTSRNLGVRHSRGRYIAVLDSDDVWMPRKLQEQMELMQIHPEVGLVYGMNEYWYDWAEDEMQVRHYGELPMPPSDRVYHPPELLKLCYPLGRFNSPCPSDFLFRRDVFDEISGFEEVFDPEHQLYEDQAFLAKLYLHAPVFVAAANWFRYRIHDKSWSAESDRLGRSEATRRFYFSWLDQYLRDNHVVDDEIWQSVLRFSPYYHPWRAATSQVQSMIDKCRTLIKYASGLRIWRR